MRQKSNELLYELLKTSPQLKTSDAQLLLRDSYETMFGIYNHETAPLDRELAIMAMHPAEDAHTDSLLYERIEQFGQKQVTKYFGLSLTEFLEYPRDLVFKVLEECEKLRTKESTDTQKVLNQLGEPSR